MFLIWWFGCKIGKYCECGMWQLDEEEKSKRKKKDEENKK